jgi:hypothetical protein
MENFSSPDLRNNLHTGKIQCCGLVRTATTQDPHEKKLKLKQYDIQTEVMGDLTEVYNREWHSKVPYHPSGNDNRL